MLSIRVVSHIDLTLYGGSSLASSIRPRTRWTISYSYPLLLKTTNHQIVKRIHLKINSLRVDGPGSTTR